MIQITCCHNWLMKRLKFEIHILDCLLCEFLNQKYKKENINETTYLIKKQIRFINKNFSKDELIKYFAEHRIGSSYSEILVNKFGFDFYLFYNHISSGKQV